MHVINVFDTFLKESDAWLFEFIYSLQQEGVGVSVATKRRYAPEQFPFSPVLAYEQLNSIFRAGYQAGHPAYSSAVRYWAKQLDWRKPELVHAIGAWSFEEAIQLSDRLNLPLVATVLPRDLHNERHEEILKKIFERATAILTTFAADRDQLLMRGCSEYKTQVWYPGISDAEPFDSQDENNIELVTGACGEKKEDISLLIKAVSMVENPRIHLSVIGRENDHRLKWLAADLGAPGRISFISPTPQERLDMLRAAEAYILPGPVKFFPAAAIRAAQQGAVLIAAESPQMAEVIQHDQTGLLIEPGSVPAFCQAIDHISWDKKRRQAYADAAAHLLTPFSRKKSARHLKGIYQYVLNQS